MSWRRFLTLLQGLSADSLFVRLAQAEKPAKVEGAQVVGVDEF